MTKNRALPALALAVLLMAPMLAWAGPGRSNASMSKTPAERNGTSQAKQEKADAPAVARVPASTTGKTDKPKPKGKPKGEDTAPAATPKKEHPVGWIILSALGILGSLAVWPLLWWRKKKQEEDKTFLAAGLIQGGRQPPRY